MTWISLSKKVDEIKKLEEEHSWKKILLEGDVTGGFPNAADIWIQLVKA